MKLLVCTLAIGPEATKIQAASDESQRAYAKKVGAKYRVITSAPEGCDPYYAKSLIAEYLKEFDRVLYVDTDVLISPNAPNVFDLVGPEFLGAFNEGQFFDERKVTKRVYCRDIGVTEDEWCASPHYFNTGVLVASKKHAALFEELRLKPKIYSFFEQTALNYLFLKHGVQVQLLDYKFNRMPWISSMSGEIPFDCEFLHFAGLKDETFSEFLKEQWGAFKRFDRSAYTPKNILLYMAGGLGDLVSQEPVLRYAYNNFFKNDNLSVYTFFPEVFEGYDLPVKFLKFDRDEMPDIGFYIFDSYPNESNIQNRQTHCFSPNLVHPLDYGSLNAFGTILHGEDRRIRLPRYKVKIGDYSNAVLIHPGRSWPSKTFPADFWEMVIEEVKQAEFRPVLVGNENGGPTGIVKLNAPGVESLINKTSIPELFEVCRSAAGIITNDTSILHIGGAVGTWVAAISTIKKIEHLRPYGSMVEDLANGKLKRNLAPNVVNPTSLKYATEKEVRELLPNRQKIRNWLFNL